MKDTSTTHPPNRILAAFTLLAFAVAAVVAGIFAITAPAQQVAPMAVVIVAVVAVAAIAIAKKARGESLLDTIINMLLEAVTVLASILGIMPTTRTAFAGMDFNDTGQGQIGTPLLRRHQTDNQHGTLFHRRRHHGAIDTTASEGMSEIAQT